MKGCNCKFAYHSEEYGAIVLRCGKWTEVNKNSNHQMQKFCYDCLDDFYEKFLKSDVNNNNFLQVGQKCKLCKHPEVELRNLAWHRLGKCVKEVNDEVKNGY